MSAKNPFQGWMKLNIGRFSRKDHEIHDKNGLSLFRLRIGLK